MSLKRLPVNSMNGPESDLRRKTVAARFLFCLAILYPSIIRGYLAHDYQEFAAMLLTVAAVGVACYVLARCDSD